MYATSRRSTHPTDVIARVMVWPVAIVPGEATLLEVAEALAAGGRDNLSLVLLDVGVDADHARGARPGVEVAHEPA